ncbi:FAD-dependent monooxygenase [Streptomyces sp. NPDC004629]|uniref:FAD-dependent monooxygenase n=1 Tax=Streptomyces sp. NPDC004629 TaxID=3364705 RepID=UPI0036947FA8
MTHSDRADHKPPVLVIGGGPVGLTVALLLARHDVPTVVLEQRRERSDAPRAHVINPRSLEIYRSLDFDVPAMIEGSAAPQDDTVSHFDWRITGARFGSVPFERHDDTHTPHPRINLKQPDLERILLREVARSPLVDLRVGHRVTGLVDEEKIAVATVLDDDKEYEISGEYVLACDGANSEVRERLGIEMHGQPDVQSCLTIHFEGSLRNLVGDRPGMFYWAVGAKLPGLFLAYDIDKTWVYISLMAPKVVPSAEEARDIVHDALGTDRVDIAVRHVSPWLMTAQVADRYRDGRVFLLGDAAHRFPPSGGLGLNTGIQDAHNLAWKIKAVMSGWAGDQLLDTYEAERRRVAEINTEQSLANAASAVQVFQLRENSPQEEWDRAIAGMYDSLNSLALQIGFTYAEEPAPHKSVQEYVPRAVPGDRLPHAWLDGPGEHRSTLDLLDPRSFTLLLGQGGAAPEADLGDAPLTVVALDAELGLPSWWMGLTGLDGAGAVLVRPDGHIVARTTDAGAAGQDSLRRSLRALLGS